MSHLEGAFEQVTRQLTSLDTRVGALDRKIHQRIDFVLMAIDRRFMWTIGIIVASWITTILAIFFHH